MYRTVEHMKSVRYNEHGRAHAVRNEQREYVSRTGTNVVVYEMFCGRKHAADGCHDSDAADCKTCLKGVAKSALTV